MTMQTDDNPCALSALVARRLIGLKQLSPVELLDACIARIEAVNPRLNAFVATCFDRARDEAKVAEAQMMRGATLAPLHGLPIGIKDLSHTEGLVTTYGSTLYADHIPAKDELVVARVRAAGAIVLGKTNTPEFGAGGNTVNRVYGATVNPFNTDLTCGGSSGGSAVALAADMVPLCTGSDTGGSLRTPSSFCGTSTIRTTPGTVPSDRRAIGLTTYNVQGPMARDMGDVALLLSCMAGVDVSDPLSFPIDTAGMATVADVDLAGLRVAFSEDLGFAPVANIIRETFKERVNLMRDAFGHGEWRDPPLANGDRVFWLLRGQHYLASHLPRFLEHGDKLGPNVRTNVEAALAMKPEEFAWAAVEQTRMYRECQHYFADIDILICPTASVPPFPVDQLFCDEIDGVTLDHYIQWANIVSGITLIGHPVAQIPCGYGPTGTPFGIQVIGARRHDDARVLAIASALERLFATSDDLARPRPDIAALMAW